MEMTHYVKCCYIAVQYLCLKDRHLAKAINMLILLAMWLILKIHMPF